MGEDLQELFDPSTITPWDLLFAAMSVVAALIVARLARRGVLAMLARVRGLGPTARSMAGRVVKYAVILMGVGIALSFLGASVQPVLAMALIVGIVLVLTLRGISTNFAAGLLLQTRQPIRIGHEIECDGYVGSVVELNARSVVIDTRDGRRVHIPNAYLLETPLVNHSSTGGRRSEVEARIACQNQSRDAIVALVREAVETVPGVRSDPAPQLLITLAAEDRLTVRIRYWHDPLSAPETTSAVVRALWSALETRRLTGTVTSDLPAPPLTSPSAW